MGRRMQPRNEKFFTLFSKAGSNVVESAAIEPFPTCRCAGGVGLGCTQEEVKLLVDGLSTKTTCPPGASRACLPIGA